MFVCFFLLRLLRELLGHAVVGRTTLAVGVEVAIARDASMALHTLYLNRGSRNPPLLLFRLDRVIMWKHGANYFLPFCNRLVAFLKWN